MTLRAASPIFGPICSYYANTSQVFSSNVEAVIQYNTANFDPNSAFNPATYQFKPKLAGYYKINASIFIQSTAGNLTAEFLTIRKNGAHYSYGSGGSISGTTIGLNADGIVYLNGTTDYVDASTLLTGSGTISLDIVTGANIFEANYLRP